MNLEEYQVALREDIESQTEDYLSSAELHYEIIGPLPALEVADFGLIYATDLKNIKLKDLLEWNNFLFIKGKRESSFLKLIYEDIDKGFFCGYYKVIKGPNLWLNPIPKFNPNGKYQNVKDYLRMIIVNNLNVKMRPRNIEERLIEFESIVNSLRNGKLSLSEEAKRKSEQEFNNSVYSCALIEHYERLFGIDEELRILNEPIKKVMEIKENVYVNRKANLA